MELKFELFASQMSEVIQDYVHNFIEISGDLPTLLNFPQLRARLHADGLKAAGAPPGNFVGFVDRIKI